MMNKVEDFLIKTGEFFEDLQKQSQTEPENMIDIHEKMTDGEFGLINC